MEEPPSGEQAAAPAVAADGAEFDWEELSEPESAASWEEPEEEILILEEADILEEEDLGIDSFITAETASVEGALKWEESEEKLTAGPDEDIFAAPEPAMAAGQADEEEFSLSEEGPEWGFAEPDLEEEEPLDLEEEGVPAEPVLRPAPAPASPESVAAQVQGLSDEDLARVVEKVAGTVIERLASTILEKIAWEVVPDLAESMIRDELRRLKGEG
jgi:hypothetical protein